MRHCMVLWGAGLAAGAGGCLPAPRLIDRAFNTRPCGAPGRAPGDPITNAELDWRGAGRQAGRGGATALEARSAPRRREAPSCEGRRVPAGPASGCRSPAPVFALSTLRASPAPSLPLPPFASAFSARPGLTLSYGLGPAHGWQGGRLELRVPSRGLERRFHTVGLGLGGCGGQEHAAASVRGYFMRSVTASNATYSFWELGAGPVAHEDSDATIASGPYAATGARLKLGAFMATISIGAGAAWDDHEDVLALAGELSLGITF